MGAARLLAPYADDIDPLNAGENQPARLLTGKIRMTVVTGRIVAGRPE